VRSQTFCDLEYLLCDNASDDGSSEIAKAHAATDSRLRFVRFEEHLPQVENYNRALRLLGPDFAYCKIVQADDWLLPECLQRMVELADAHPQVGLIGGYYFKGGRVLGSGPDPEQSFYNGRDVLREKLLTGRFGLGSPTSQMYRADLVRARSPFFPVGRYHEDTDVVYELLSSSDLAYVPQVLAVQRTGNPSIRTRTARYDDVVLDRLIQVETYASRFLGADEATRLRRNTRRGYFRCLGRHAWGFPGPDFWKYHFRGLATIDWSPPYFRIGVAAILVAIESFLNPLDTARRIAGRLWR